VLIPLGSAANGIISAFCTYNKVAVPSANAVDGGNMFVPVGYAGAVEPDVPDVWYW
jgi:hypothetical protein